MGKRFVILGNGIAGFSAAAELRRQSREAEITLISEEAEPAITSYPYDTGIYALGARCFVPPFSGAEKTGVAAVRTAEDFSRVRRLAAVASRGIVIGGGTIGLELAWKLFQAGCPVTILEAGPRLLGRLLDEESAAVLWGKVRAQGIPAYCGVSIQELTGKDRVTGVTLGDGRWFPADLVIISCGIRANIELAERAGILCGRGVLVDDFLQTSHPDFLAAGDCIQWKKPNPGLWNYARQSGTFAGFYAASRRPGGSRLMSEGFSPGAEPVILNCMGTSLFSAGSVEEGEGIETYVEGRTSGENGPEGVRFLVNHHEGEKEPYRKFFVKDGILQGAVLMGNLSGLMEIKAGIGRPFRKPAK